MTAVVLTADYRATCFMFNSYQHPDKIFDYAKLYTVSVLCSLLYGQRAVDLNSFWYKDFYHMMDNVRDLHQSFELAQNSTHI